MQLHQHHLRGNMLKQLIAFVIWLDFGLVTLLFYQIGLAVLYLVFVYRLSKAFKGTPLALSQVGFIFFIIGFILQCGFVCMVMFFFYTFPPQKWHYALDMIVAFGINCFFQKVRLFEMVDVYLKWCFLNMYNNITEIIPLIWMCIRINLYIYAYLFIEKWDAVLWIDSYIETNGTVPTCDTISEELGISLAISEVYLHYHEHLEREKDKDVDELLSDFNVYNDCVIFWFVIVQILTTVQTKSLWLLFNPVAELTPGNVAIELLDRYKFDLTRFAADTLNQLAQNIVIGSQYPVCASLRMVKWFMDIGEYDVARGHVFEEISESFVDAAFDYLDLIESDHMAVVILEVKSDINGMNALDMALEYQLTKFVSNQRIERVTTSVMNDFEFLRPKNRMS